MRVLDIGCGWGGLAYFMAKHYDVSVIGVTISAEQQKLARERCQGLDVDIRLQDYRDLNEQFDLIVLDLILPKLTGFEVLEELKKKKSTTPVIVASNLSQGEDQERAKTLGARDYFVKSDTSLSQVVEHITKILNG
jgi:DNA-binding response OmpR family regulator